MSVYDGGLTLDTGVLIALERPATSRARKVTALIARRLERCRTVTLPSIVLAEWWRDPPNRALPMYSPLRRVTLVPLHPSLAKLAGWALGQVGEVQASRTRSWSNRQPTWRRGADVGPRGSRAAGGTVLFRASS